MSDYTIRGANCYGLRIGLFVRLAMICVLFNGIALVPGRADDNDVKRMVLSQCYRDRSISSALARAEERLKSDATADAISLLQWILDQPFDGFVETPSGIASAKALAEKHLSSLPQSLYRSRFETSSKLAFEDVADGKSQIESVVQRYLLTQSGNSALEQLMATWIDHGEYELASAMIDRVRQTVPGGIQAAEGLDRWNQKLRKSMSLPAGKQSHSKDLSSEKDAPRGGLNVNAADSMLMSGWMVSGGDHRRNRVVSGSMPLLRPLWTIRSPLALNSIHDSTLLTTFEGRLRDMDRPVCAAVHPLVVKRKLVFRTADSLVAFNADNGQPEWNCSLESSSDRSVDLLNDQNRVPRGFDRQTNAAISPHDSLFENTVMGLPSSDGRFVYAVAGPSQSAVESADELGVSPQERMALDGNRLVAILIERANSASRQIAWVCDGFVSPGIGSTKQRIRFLGSPLPGATELLCVTEQRGEIHLTALFPRSGEVLWTQPVCVLDRMSTIDGERVRSACTPARSNGVVVFPTNTGLVVAVDQARRRLLWATFVDDVPDAQQQRLRGRYIAPLISSAGFGSHIVLSQQKVVYLSPRSGHIHCLDLMTGKSLWAASRRDGEYVANVVENKVLVVGRQGLRCMLLEDGGEVWNASTAMPSGRGLCLNGQFIQPLEDGRLAVIDVASGKLSGRSAPFAEFPLGHLIADDQRIYSFSHRGLVAFPQAHQAMAELTASNELNRSESEKELLLADIELASGRVADAEQRVRRLWSREAIPAMRNRVGRQLKDLLMEKLLVSGGEAFDDWKLLEPLLETPSERFQFLVVRSRKDRNSESDQLNDQVFQLPSGLMCQMPDEPTLSISPAVWTRMQFRDQKQHPPTELLQQKWLERAIAADDTQGRLRYVRAMQDDATVGGVRRELAEQLFRQGEPQAAETLLLRNRVSNDPQLAADAAARLYELWESAGFLDEAADQLNSLATEFAQCRLSNGISGADYVNRISSNRPARQVWQRSQRPNWRTDRVEISAELSPSGFIRQPDVQGDQAGDRVQFVPERVGSFSRQVGKSPDQPCEFVFSSLERSNGTMQVVTVFDRRTALPRGAVRLPSAHRWPVADKTSSNGHLIPLGAAGGIVGLSTLQLAESEPVWKQLPAELKGRQSATFPGPSGPEYASFLWKNSLYVLDPVDGQLLWQRTLKGITPEMASNQRLDVFGDRDVLVVQSPDRSSYEVFETSTGRALHSIRPGFDPRQWQMVYGHRVVGITDTPGSKSLLVHDLKLSVAEISVPVGERVLPFPLGRGEIAFFHGNGRINVIDMSQGRMSFETTLDSSELTGFGAFRVFADHERYYVNLQRQTPSALTTNYNQALIDTPLSGSHVRDDLYAFDRSSRQLLWKRSIPYRTVLQFPRCRVPFLVAVSVVKDRQNTNLQSLTVEVINSSTGETIGYRENLPYDRLITADYDGLSGRIVLGGQSTSIELRFELSVQRKDQDGL